MSRLYRLLRRERRRAAAGANAGGPRLQDWDREAQRIAGQPPPFQPEEPDLHSPAPTAAQLQAYAQGLNNGTAAGPDHLPPELLKYAPSELFAHLERVVRAHWDDNSFPKEWTQSLQIPIPKKPRPRNTDDYRPIALCTVIYKLLAKHILFLLQAKLPQLPQQGTPAHVLALDLKAAFPSISMEAAVRVLREEGISPFLVNRVLATAFTDATSYAWGRERTAPVLRGRGVRQGYPLSPWLFTLIMHWAIRRAVLRTPAFSLELGVLLPAILAYADDLLLLSTRRADLEELLQVLLPELAELGLHINAAKCEYLLRFPPTDRNPLPPPKEETVELAGHRFPWVDKLVYLGAVIRDRLDRPSIIKHRAMKGKRALAGLFPSLQRYPLPDTILQRLYQTVILPTLTYELATSSSTLHTRSKLTREANIMRRALLATARGRRPGQPIPPPDLSDMDNKLTRARIGYLGHILRRPANHPLRAAQRLEAAYKKRGRPCFTFKTDLGRDLGAYPEPEQGWAALLRSKTATSSYLRRTPTLPEEERREFGEEELEGMLWEPEQVSDSD
ncbi:hypothetical protein ONE63_005201 [Megalurothrips usitatus]|uniref:Reverse transcriptase domain-containing protein n=1 Tax=Megalurothrips usitatus TaxID=439358 RepID=A0AAV7Y1Z9_9NEOP|nr:hypothetical protein ONE63_005201 [Megalurothrips usitatus]